MGIDAAGAVTAQPVDGSVLAAEAVEDADVAADLNARLRRSVIKLNAFAERLETWIAAQEASGDDDGDTRD